MKHLIDIMELTTEEIDEMITVAKDIIAHPDRYAEKCRGKKLATLFSSRQQGPDSASRRQCMSWGAMY